VVESVAHTIQDFIVHVGYPGLFLLIVLESTMVPVPSMLLMPFAGYLAQQGELSLATCLIINATAAMTGSTLSYLLGVHGGRPFIDRWGKWVLLRHEDIDRTHEFFERYGAWTIFVARFLPVVRHVISVPAGIARMRFPTFLALTCLGATAWDGGLMVVGYFLGPEWQAVANSGKKVDLVVGGLILVTVVFLAVRFVTRRRREREVPSREQ
jgi:membrane protein DedA with SNARE-associated domain